MRRCLTLALLLILPALAHADADALWRIVHGQCVPQQQQHGTPAPCAEVSLSGRYAVLKSIEGELQYLLIPTERLSGIESPALLRADTPDYFARAWDARDIMARRYGRPIARENLALSINSQHGRSQNQLHIHLSCVKPALKQRLARLQTRIGTDWAPLPGKLDGKPYWARRVDGPTLDGVLPFRDLAAHLPGAGTDMGAYTLAVVGMHFADGHDGFVLLAERARPLWMDFASSEADVQDHRCSVLRQP